MSTLTGVAATVSNTSKVDKKNHFKIRKKSTRHRTPFDSWKKTIAPIVKTEPIAQATMTENTYKYLVNARGEVHLNDICVRGDQTRDDPFWFGAFASIVRIGFVASLGIRAISEVDFRCPHSK